MKSHNKKKCSCSTITPSTRRGKSGVYLVPLGEQASGYFAYRKLGGLHSISRRFGQGKTLSVLAGNQPPKPRLSSPYTRHYTHKGNSGRNNSSQQISVFIFFVATYVTCKVQVYHSSIQMSQSLVIILDVPPSHTYTPLLTSNPFMSLFTVWRINFSTIVLLTLTLFFFFNDTATTEIYTSSIQNIYTNGPNIFCCNFSPSGCSVFSIVIIFHCWNIGVCNINSHEYLKW
jgi:hypothetical protein